MSDEREAMKAAKLDHCEREMFRAPSCDGCFEAGWNAGLDAAKSTREADEAELERLREALRESADALSDAASVLWADGSHQNSRWTDESAKKARAALSPREDA